MKPLILSFVCTSSLVSLTGCPGDPCEATGKNQVNGEAIVTASEETCTGQVSGRLDDTDGQTIVYVWCAPPGVSDPSLKPSREFTIALGDPRSIDATSTVTATESIVSGSTSVWGSVPANVTILESAGAKAPLPAAATDDFVRHFVVLTGMGAGDVSVDVTIRAADLQQPEMYCNYCLGF